MRELQRFVVKLAGESGMGVNSVGEIFAKAVKNSGMYIFAYREYPSLIKGGFAHYQIDIADYPINSSSRECDVLLCLSREALIAYLDTVTDGGLIIHNVIKTLLGQRELEIIAQKNITLCYVPSRELVLQLTGNKLMANTLMLGVVWQVLGVELEPLIEMVRHIFHKKPAVIDGNITCLKAGFAFSLPSYLPAGLKSARIDRYADDLLMTGNHAIALGAISAGVRAYYAYPMTPSSSILSYLSAVSEQTGMLVKQIEDEISVANMAVGSMFVGTRTLIGTSGGGFDLMTETISLAAMTETPLVCVLAQRPGPATGLPTWTNAADLNLAVYAGHGEYTRLVIAAHDLRSCYLAVQHAFNFAEKYQIPVIVLTEKQVAESIFQVDALPQPVPIQRSLVSETELAIHTSDDRFAVTQTGISPRWLPGQSDQTFIGNSDEHLGDGSLTEDAQPAAAMYQKRLDKEKGLLQELSHPEIFGSSQPDISFVGWGSVKNTMLDVITILEKTTGHRIAYLHYEYVFPLKTEVFMRFAAAAKQLVLIENNATGQLGRLLTAHTGVLLPDMVLKYDGRPFFLEDILEAIKERSDI